MAFSSIPSPTLAEWLHCASLNLRPAALEVRLEGFPARQHPPRMASMNKPLLEAIRSNVGRRCLVILPSPAQVFATAKSLIALMALDHESIIEDGELVRGLSDERVKHALGHGIGIHLPGHRDAAQIKALFEADRLLCLLAWAETLSADLPNCHCLFIKGVERWSISEQSYVDLDYGHLLHLLSHASQSACLMMEESKKVKWRTLLKEGINLESSLCLEDQLIRQAEGSFMQARISQNPDYYAHLSLTQAAKNMERVNPVLAAKHAACYPDLCETILPTGSLCFDHLLLQMAPMVEDDAIPYAGDKQDLVSEALVADRATKERLLLLSAHFHGRRLLRNRARISAWLAYWEESMRCGGKEDWWGVVRMKIAFASQIMPASVIAKPIKPDTYDLVLSWDKNGKVLSSLEHYPVSQIVPNMIAVKGNSLFAPIK